MFLLKFAKTFDCEDYVNGLIANGQGEELSIVDAAGNRNFIDTVLGLGRDLLLLRHFHKMSLTLNNIGSFGMLCAIAIGFCRADSQGLQALPTFQKILEVDPKVHFTQRIRAVIKAWTEFRDRLPMEEIRTLVSRRPVQSDAVNLPRLNAILTGQALPMLAEAILPIYTFNWELTKWSAKVTTWWLYLGAVLGPSGEKIISLVKMGLYPAFPVLQAAFRDYQSRGGNAFDLEEYKSQVTLALQRGGTANDVNWLFSDTLVSKALNSGDSLVYQRPHYLSYEMRQEAFMEGVLNCTGIERDFFKTTDSVLR